MTPGDSLEKLTISLRNGDQYDISKFKYSRKYFQSLYPAMTDDDFKLIISKGVYPYEYMTSFDKFNEPKLPPIECFYSSLNDEIIQDKEYKHALNVWNTFNIKNLGDYHDFYLKTDVLLLTDIFENYRDIDLATYNLDSAHYVTVPSFSLDAALRKYGKPIEVFHNGPEHENMYNFIEKILEVECLLFLIVILWRITNI